MVKKNHANGEFAEFLCNRLQSGKVMIFLGAGASIGSKNQLQTDPPVVSKLCDIIAGEISINFDPMVDSFRSLSQVAERKLGTRQYYDLLRLHYQHCAPSSEYRSLAKYNWKRIYSTNIDDALEKAIIQDSDQNLQVINYLSPLRDSKSDVNEVHLIKLHGSVDRLEQGIIFSVDDYAREHVRDRTWYDQLSIDYLSQTFVFIGTKLDEPLFYHHIEKSAKNISGMSGESYIVCPSFSDIQKEEFQSRNFITVEGTFADFIRFVDKCLGPSFTSDDLIKNSYPAYHSVFSVLPEEQKVKAREQASTITVLSRDVFKSDSPKTGIRDFYFGSIPQWSDILDGVPAKLEFHHRILKALEDQVQIVVVHGPAGCGKTTALMSVGLEYGSKRGNYSVFYINNIKEFPTETISNICMIKDLNPIFVVDDFEWCHLSIKSMIDKGKANGATFLVSERSTAWNRVSIQFREVKKKVIRVEKISHKDVPALLENLEKFGPWGRLARMSQEERVTEIIDHADRQLLVALKEVTEGRRFDEILEDEYRRIEGDYERLAFHIAGLATLHRLRVSYETFDWALNATTGEVRLPRGRNLEGIIIEDTDSVSLRHSVIADFLIRRIADRQELLEAIESLLTALGRYDSPIAWHAHNREYQLYSAVTNHRFVADLFRADKESGIYIYKKFEKTFEKDGLYWLQYALYEMKIGKSYYSRALDHIRLALATFPTSFQIIHAYAHIHFDIASNAGSVTEAHALVEDASEILEQQISERPNDAYPLVALAEGRMKVFRKWFRQDIRKEAKIFVERLREMERISPNDSRIKKAIWEISLLSSQS